MNFLPTRRFAFFAIATLVAVSGFLYVRGLQSSSEEGRGESAAITFGDAHTCPDEDRDELCDWEEELFGTDPQNPDSNGNGIFDGEEYKSKKKYPDLSYENIGALYGFKNDRFSSGSGNLTDTLTREAMLRYSALTAEGEVGDEALVALTDTLSKDFTRSQRKHYTAGDITIDTRTDIVAANAYTADVLMAFEAHPDVHNEDPIALMNEWIQTSDDNYLESLTTIKKAHEGLAKELSEITVPSHLVNVHLELVNSTYDSSRAIGGMLKAVTDPVQSMLGSASYLSTRTKRQEAIIALLEYYKKINL